MDLGALPLIITLLVVLTFVVITAGSVAVMFWLRKATQGMSPFAVAPVVPMTAPQGGAKQIKKVRCRNCGASKVQPPKTAFLYCDFCGALMDVGQPELRCTGCSAPFK